MKRIATLALALALAACGSQPTNDVQAAQLGYEAALIVAVKYNQLPRCTPTGPKVCSVQAVVEQLRKADDAAIASLAAAKNVVVTPGATTSAIVAAQAAASQAVTAFTTILNVYQIK